MDRLPPTERRTEPVPPWRRTALLIVAGGLALIAGSGAAVVVGRLTDAAWSSLHAERTTEAVGQLERERRERYAELAGVKREQAAVAGSAVDGDGSVWRQAEDALLAAIQREKAALAGSEDGQAPPQSPALSRELVNSLGMRFVLISAGSFEMGSRGGLQDEQVTHQVTISRPFYVGVHEVTNADGKAVDGFVPSRWKDDSLPLESVTWDEAAAFCDALSALPSEQAAGRVYRLPTEAEWEYACRAGSAVSPSVDNDDAVLRDVAWDDHNAQGQTHPVGQTQPNAWGLYDMRGNVWEWCSDWYAAYPAGSVRDPQGPSTGAFRVCRGGSWAYPARFHRPTLRGWRKPTARGASFGFRLVLSPPEPVVTDG